MNIPLKFKFGDRVRVTKPSHNCGFCGSELEATEDEFTVERITIHLCDYQSTEILYGDLGLVGYFPADQLKKIKKSKRG